MKDLQKMFNEAEQNLQEGLESFAVNCDYKKLVSTIMELPERVFDMLYDEDTENFEEYEIDFEDLEIAHDKLRRLTDENY